MSNYEKLKVVMTEYEILKREAMERVKFQLQTYPLVLAATSLIFGYVIVNEKYEALLLLPFITILLAYRWIWDVKLLDANRKYLLNIEKEIIPKLMISPRKEKEKNSSLRLIGYQTYYENWRKRQPKWDWLISAFLLFAVPTGIGIAYCLYSVLSDLAKTLPLQFIFHLSATITYILLSLGIVWIGIRTYHERKAE